MIIAHAGKCLNLNPFQTPDVLASEFFVDLDKETLIELISRETLYCEEWELFEGVLRWVAVEAERQGFSPDAGQVNTSIASDFLPYIRFTNMALEDFILHVSKTSVLSLEVVSEYFYHILFATFSLSVAGLFVKILVMFRSHANILI